MYVVIVEIQVKPEHVEAFVAASRDNHVATRRDEPGNVRWDLLAVEEDACHFVLHEVYRTAEDFPRHQQTPHYLRWKERVAEMMAAPRVARRCHSVFPADADWDS